MTDQPNIPAPKLYWKVTNPDGSIDKEGFALPVIAGAKAAQGKDQPQQDKAQDAPEGAVGNEPN